MKEDPNELTQRLNDTPETAATLRAIAVAELNHPNADRALENGAH